MPECYINCLNAYLNKYPSSAYGFRNFRSVYVIHLRETVKHFQCSVNWSDEERIFFYYYLCFIKLNTTNQSEFSYSEQYFHKRPAVIKTDHYSKAYSFS